MLLQSYLDRIGVPYQISFHSPAFSAQDLAEKEHIPGSRIAKPVVVKADGCFVMCALPASCRVDFVELADELHAHHMRLADENELAQLFPDCQLGAEPPVGFLYGMPTWMDRSLMADDRIMFQAGTHESAVTLTMEDYRRIAQPELGEFAKGPVH
ncbi:MAG TPA: YbaK/EbsC family protein [Tepidisphaeraceae bacterium]|nr:YbaK/EbsC family protein [Tepidisphaeraceae bacterium]